jgi:LmbE family N-acetylglucosaminyl deacetylase
MSTRRDFFGHLSVGAAALAAPAEAAETTTTRNIMAIAAHPGDAFFAMGLPVALEAQRGGQCVVLSLSLGEKGSSTIPPARYGKLQQQAAERAASMLKARASFLTYPDGEVPASEEAKFAVCDRIREFKPDVVVTHWRESMHKDHTACYQVVKDAIFYAALPAFARKLPAHGVSKLFFADNWEDARGFEADTYLDVTSIFDRWAEACAVFPMWRGETGFRYNDYYRSRAIDCGCLSGSQYAVALMSPPEQLVRHVQAL